MEMARSLAKIRKIYFLLLQSKVNGKIENKTKQTNKKKKNETMYNKMP